MTTPIFDTHTHLYAPEFVSDVADEVMKDGASSAVERAIDANVRYMMLPACELSDLPAIESLRSHYPENIYVAAGIHPENIPSTERISGEMHRLREYVSDNRSHLSAIGEIGIDLYWDKSRLEDQMTVFREQCLLALDEKLPVIIHCREALPNVLSVLRDLPQVPQGVFHCFAGTKADVEAIQAIGDFYFGIGGILTFKKSTLPEVVRAIPKERLLLETDAPYMAPVPMRGKRNESAFLPYVAEKLASILQSTPDEIAAVTTRNAFELFGVPCASLIP